ncbi:MAG: hypothetical protein ABFD81_00750 [Syntrophaceae bacterium]
MRQFHLYMLVLCLVILVGGIIPTQALGQEGDFSFPLSGWNKDQAWPEIFIAAARQREKAWPAYISEQEQLFTRLYGNGVKNSYDLFVKEQSAAVGAPAINKKTLKRLIDVACIPGKSLCALRGAPLANLRVVAFKEGALRVIPADFLEFTAAGRVVLPTGPEGNPKDGDGVLSDNDRLFFLAVDSGHQVKKDYIAATLKGAKDIQEIELAYTPDNERAWVYVVSFSGAAPDKSPIDYIRISKEAAIIYTPFYLVQAKPRIDKGCATPTIETATWAIAPSMGGRPQDIHNALSLNIKLSFRPIGSSNENQDSFNMRIRAWYDGAVINVDRASWMVKTPMGIGAPTIIADIIASPFSLVDQNFLCTPFDPTLIMRSFNLTLGESLNSNAISTDTARTCRLITPANRKGFAVDGKTATGEGDQENKARRRDLWHVLTGPCGSMCVFAGLNDYLAQHAANFNLLYSDTPEAIGWARYNLEVKDFKNRQEHMYMEWNVVPDFDNNGQYNWKNLDLVFKHHEKPLAFTVNGEARTVSNIFSYIPDVKNEKAAYRY